MSPSEGTPRQETFFGEEDYQHYLERMTQFCRAEQVATWAYCLMPNHVHLIVVPQSAESLRRAIGEADPRYTRWINFREGWRGHLWQGGFACSPRSSGNVGSEQERSHLGSGGSRADSRSRTISTSVTPRGPARTGRPHDRLLGRPQAAQPVHAQPPGLVFQRAGRAQRSFVLEAE